MSDPEDHAHSVCAASASPAARHAYVYPVRKTKVFVVTQSELESLVNGFAWDRRRVANRIVKECGFDE